MFLLVWKKDECLLLSVEMLEAGDTYVAFIHQIRPGMCWTSSRLHGWWETVHPGSHEYKCEVQNHQFWRKSTTFSTNQSNSTLQCPCRDVPEPAPHLSPTTIKYLRGFSPTDLSRIDFLSQRMHISSLLSSHLFMQKNKSCDQNQETGLKAMTNPDINVKLDRCKCQNDKLSLTLRDCKSFSCMRNEPVSQEGCLRSLLLYQQGEERLRGKIGSQKDSSRALVMSSLSHKAATIPLKLKQEPSLVAVPWMTTRRWLQNRANPSWLQR